MIISGDQKPNGSDQAEQPFRSSGALATVLIEQCLDNDFDSVVAVSAAEMNGHCIRTAATLNHGPSGRWLHGSPAVIRQWPENAM
jgi:hypothetical protein